jgi:hypothetical protein
MLNNNEKQRIEKVEANRLKSKLSFEQAKLIKLNRRDKCQ